MRPVNSNRYQGNSEHLQLISIVVAVHNSRIAPHRNNFNLISKNRWIKDMSINHFRDNTTGNIWPCRMYEFIRVCRILFSSETQQNRFLRCTEAYRSMNKSFKIEVISIGRNQAFPNLIINNHVLHWIQFKDRFSWTRHTLALKH